MTYGGFARIKGTLLGVGVYIGLRCFEKLPCGVPGALFG